MNKRLEVARRIVPSVMLVASLAVGAAACSGSDSNGDKTSSSSSTKSDTKKASKAVNDGLDAHSKGDLTTAAKDYKLALKYEPTNKFALYNLALIDEAQGNYGLAEEKYRAALKTDPAYEPALYNLAILRTSRDPQEAMALYQRAVEANPKDASAMLNLGLLQRAAGQKALGDANVAKAVALNPKLKDPAAK